jgi:carbon storage regulator
MHDVASRQEVSVLVLSRKQFERIVIDGYIWITVLLIRDHVRLHIYPESTDVLCLEPGEFYEPELEVEASGEASGQASRTDEAEPPQKADSAMDAPPREFYIAPHPHFEQCPGLVVTRYTDEQIVIEGDIVVTIVEIRGDKVRIGIEAPIEVEVHRKEVYEKIYGPADPASECED